MLITKSDKITHKQTNKKQQNNKTANTTKIEGELKTTKNTTHKQQQTRNTQNKQST